MFNKVGDKIEFVAKLQCGLDIIASIVLGFFIAKSIDEGLLRLGFALLLLFIGVKELFRKEK